MNSPYDAGIRIHPGKETLDLDKFRLGNEVRLVQDQHVGKFNLVHQQHGYRTFIG